MKMLISGLTIEEATRNRIYYVLREDITKEEITLLTDRIIRLIEEGNDAKAAYDLWTESKDAYTIQHTEEYIEIIKEYIKEAE